MLWKVGGGAESRIGTMSGRKEEGGRLWRKEEGRKEEASSSHYQPLPSRKFGFLPIPNILRKPATP